MRDENGMFNEKMSHLMDEFGGWDLEALLNDEEFMRRQRNRMMYNALVLKGRFGKTLTDYLEGYDKNNEEGYHTRGLRFIADMINTGMEENGEEVVDVTADELYADPIMANNYLYKAIGIEAFTTMLLRGEHQHGDDFNSLAVRLHEKLHEMELDHDLMAEVKDRVVYLMSAFGTRGFSVYRSLEPEGFEISQSLRKIYQCVRKTDECSSGMHKQRRAKSILSWDNEEPTETSNLSKQINRAIKKYNRELSKIANIDITLEDKMHITEMELLSETLSDEDARSMGSEHFQRMYRTFMTIHREETPKQLDKFKDITGKFSQGQHGRE